MKLVGREQELRVLRTAVRAVPGLVLVVGEAGAGKSRLVAEVQSSHAGRWLVGQCRPVEDQVPLAPVIEALGEPVLRSGTRHAVFSSVLDQLASAGPTVLQIEDLHWADPGTLQLLRFLAGRLPRELLLIGTYRQEDTHHAGEITALAGCVPVGVRATEIRLRPLDRTGVQELAAELLGVKSLPPALAGELLARTGGLPFVVEELLRDESFGRGAIDSAAFVRALAAKPAPVAVRASLTIRLQQVPDFCREVIRAAAVLDAPAPEAILGAVAEVSGCQLTTAMDTGLARGLVGEPKPGLFDLRHALARRAIYETIPPDEVRRLHRRAATALAAVEPPDHGQIARHSRFGGSLRDWMIHAELAADQARARGEHAVAAARLTEMLEVEALPWGDRARLAVKLGRAAGPTGDWAQAVSLMKAVLAGSTARSASRGRLRLGVGVLLQEQAGQVGAGRHELTAAIAELGEDPESAAWALSALAVPEFGAESIAEQRGWLERALLLIGDEAEGDAQFAVRRNRARYRLALGEPDDADGVEAAGALAWLGHDRRSSALLERAAEVGGSPGKAVIAATRARLDFAAGDWPGLADRLARARVEASRLPVVRAELDLVDGRLRLAQGDIAGGKELLESVLAATECGPWPLRVAAVAALGRYRGEGLMDECLALVRRKDGWAWAGELIVCAVAVRDDSDRLAAEFAAAVSDRDAPAAAASLSLVRALVEDSVELFGAAAEQYRALGRRYDECVALEGRGVRLLGAGQHEELVSVANTYEAMGARGDARRCREVLREAGVAVSPKRGRRGYGNALSPRELEVARLAADGLSNSRIAAKLTLSVSTVEDHLSHAMRKLEVRSRHDLAPLITH
ncbi:ATP-binding protein [Kribbella sp. CA-293567]|uniref:ATP-binding protein n=1 Tax=Kribbella sp. CA-293567 TaxID=3002436 RepID=UPI0022DDF761|nr:AAA family ATPase [Kribbella sp. CA-293567]WBQ08134.1 AAA family ATPase [Kribbella sp. CA-293567]